jgi:hypothetical protein
MKRFISQLEQHVNDCELRIIKCELRIIKQAEIIDRLTGMGRDTTMAVRLLHAFEDARKLTIVYKDRVCAQVELLTKSQQQLAETTHLLGAVDRTVNSGACRVACGPGFAPQEAIENKR